MKIYPQKRFSSLSEGIAGVDVVYVTRLQKERFPSEQDYLAVKVREGERERELRRNLER